MQPTHVSLWLRKPERDARCTTLSGALGLILADGWPVLRGHLFPIFGRFSHVSYATWPMRGAALVCYCISGARTTLAAVACLATPVAGSNWGKETLDMAVADRMIQTNPSKASIPQEVLVECIRACFDCAQARTACADACLGEQDTKMLVRCIRLNADCADVCAATGRIMSRETAFDARMARAILQACVASCQLCGDECAQHAQRGMRHCQVCMETCRRCEQACTAALTALPA